MSEQRFRFNVNMYTIEEDGKFLANLNVIDAHKIVQKLNEQQAIIQQLQDLCGESDGENAKLRLENKKLQDKIDMLCEKYDYPNIKGAKNDII